MLTLILIAVGTFVATMLGGFLALKIKDSLHLVLGFSAGAVIAVAFFDLLPEAFELVGEAKEPLFVTSIVAVGFAAFMVLDRMFMIHNHAEDHCENTMHRGRVGAGSLSIHSFLDGLGIGLAFQVSPAVGFVVAAAVLTHDFSDGINTVGLIIKNGGSRREALKWLALDSTAPMLGVIVGSMYTLPESTLGILLALFAGFFLYIGASDLLPESHHSHPTRWTTFMTLVGMLVLYGAIKIAGH